MLPLKTEQEPFSVCSLLNVWHTTCSAFLPYLRLISMSCFSHVHLLPSLLFLRLSPLDETSLWLLARFQTTQCGVFGSYRQRKTGRVQCSEHEAGAVLSLRWQRCADRSGEIRRSGGHRPQGLWPHDANYHERVPGDGREGHGMRSKVAFNFLGKTMQALRFWFQEQNGKHLRSVLTACDLSKQNIKKHRIKKLIR